MARKNTNMTNKKIEQYIKEGRGQGEGAEYKPWLEVGNFSSQGRGHRVMNPKTGRVHHFFSDLEADYYRHLLWEDTVVDIREQYPLLPVEEAEDIAQELGYAYPREPIENGRHVMTTDFLITEKRPDGEYLVARYVKYKKDLEKARTQEKWKIEQAYWAKRGVEIKIVTEKSFDRRRARNIEFLLGYYSALPQLDRPNVLTQIKECIWELMSPEWKYHRLSNLMQGVDNRLDLPAGTSLSVFFHLAAHKAIPLQMHNEINGSASLNEIIDWKNLKNIRKEVESHANYA